MTWARLDDQYADHPKVRSLGVFGIALQTAAICYCARYLTNGFLSYSTSDALIAAVLAPFTLPDGRIVTPAVTCGMAGQDAIEWDWKTLMVDAGLWDRAPGGFRVHDYLDYNPTKETVDREKEKTAERVKRHRSRNGFGNAVTNAHVTPAPSPSPSPKEESTPSAAVAASVNVKAELLTDKGHRPVTSQSKKPKHREVVPSPECLQFIAAYPRKAAKLDAVKAWVTLNPDAALVAEIMAAVERQKASQDWRDRPRFIPYPASYLRGRRWEDEAPLQGDGHDRAKLTEQFKDLPVGKYQL